MSGPCTARQILRLRLGIKHLKDGCGIGGKGMSPMHWGKIEQHGHTHNRNSGILCVSCPAMKPNQQLGVKTLFCYHNSIFSMTTSFTYPLLYNTKYCLSDKLAHFSLHHLATKMCFPIHLPHRLYLRPAQTCQTDNSGVPVVHVIITLVSVVNDRE